MIGIHFIKAFKKKSNLFGTASYKIIVKSTRH